MLVGLLIAELIAELIADVTLHQFAQRFAAHPPRPAVKQALPSELAGHKRVSFGYYSTPLLPSLLGKRTAAYAKCGATEAAVASYGEQGEHVTLVRSNDPACLLAIDQRSDDQDAACPDTGAVVKVRKGVTSVFVGQDYVRVRGHDDSLGGGEAARAIACALARGD